MMRVLVIEKFGLDGLVFTERDAPRPGAGEVAIRVEAISLNRRDLLLVEGTYNPRQRLPVAPGSDCAGTVAALGAGVTRFSLGDRVVPAFFPDWIAGDPTMASLMSSRGGPGGDGVFQDVVIFPAHGVLPCPAHLSFAEAACLPCAGLTAYNALFDHGPHALKPGGVALVQGTGGVSIFALQFAKAVGARVIATTSSAEKAERLRALGADHVIDYRANPKWPDAVRAVAPEGVDVVVEVGGAGTIEGSIRAVRPGGVIALVGVLAGAVAPVNLPLVVMRQVRLQGVTVGSVSGFSAMTAMIEGAGMRPVVGAAFPFDSAREAFAAMQANAVFGKIVVTREPA